METEIWNKPGLAGEFQQAASFPKVAAMMAEAKTDVLAFTAFPKAHWQKIWSNNPIERLNKEIKRRADVVEIFPNPAAFLRLATAVVIEALQTLTDSDSDGTVGSFSLASNSAGGAGSVNTDVMEQRDHFERPSALPRKERSYGRSPHDYRPRPMNAGPPEFDAASQGVGHPIPLGGDLVRVGVGEDGLDRRRHRRRMLG